MTPRRGRPPKPPDEVRTVRVTVLVTEREYATLKRACGGHGVASLLVRGGLREAAAMAPGATLAGALLDGATPERLAWLADVGEALTVTSGRKRVSRKVKR